MAGSNQIIVDALLAAVEVFLVYEVYEAIQRLKKALKPPVTFPSTPLNPPNLDPSVSITPYVNPPTCPNQMYNLPADAQIYFCYNLDTKSGELPTEGGVYTSRGGWKWYPFDFEWYLQDFIWPQTWHCQGTVGTDTCTYSFPDDPLAGGNVNYFIYRGLKLC